MLLCLLFITAAFGSIIYTDGNFTVTEPYVLLASFPPAGHLTPLLELARRLQEREERKVIVATFDLVSTSGEVLVPNSVGYVSKYFPRLDLLLLDPEPQQEREILWDIVPPLAKADRGLSATNRILYKYLKPSIMRNPPSIIIYEEFSVFAGLVAYELGIPAAVVTPHLNPGITFAHRSLGVPSVFGATTISSGFLARATNVVARLATRVLSKVIFPRLGADCEDLGIPRFRCFDIETLASHYNHLVLGITSLPLTVPGQFSQNVHIVGPLVPRVTEDPDWKTIVDQIASKSSGIIYISMGSDMELSLDQTKVLVTELEVLLQEHKLHAVWARNGLTAPSDRWTLTPFAPQKYLLSRPEVRLFLSHCGLGGVTESLYYGVPVVCFPQGRDQPLNAIMLQRVGLPKSLSLNVTHEEFRDVFSEALNNLRIYEQQAQKISKALKMAGGLDRAAQLIDGLIDLGGAEVLVDFDAHWTWTEQTNVDVFAASIGLCIFLFSLLSRCCKYCCCRRNKLKRD